MVLFRASGVQNHQNLPHLHCKKKVYNTACIAAWINCAFTVHLLFQDYYFAVLWLNFLLLQLILSNTVIYLFCSDVNNYFNDCWLSYLYLQWIFNCLDKNLLTKWDIQCMYKFEWENSVIWMFIFNILRKFKCSVFLLWLECYLVTQM